MEMEYHHEGRRRKVLIVLGVVLAVAAGGAAFFLVNQAQNAGTGVVATRDVVVAARDIPARTVIQSSDLTIRAVPDDPSLASAITAPEDAIGRITGVAILFQQPLSPNLLASAVAGGQFSILGPEETISPDSPAWRAVAVNVPDDRAVAGQIQVGQHVDLFMTAQINVTVPLTAGAATPAPSPGPGASNAPYYTDKSTKITYQDLSILARNGTLYILRVDIAQAEEISHLQAAGNAQFSLVLRPDGDDRVVDTEKLGETTNRIIEKYGLPIPEIYPAP
jgi:Flp pilus assembly protein CpaB